MQNFKEEIVCPECGSNLVRIDKKGFGAGKAFLGGILAGPAGLFAGFIGSKKIMVECLKCKHKFPAAEGYKKILIEDNEVEKDNTTALQFNNTDENITNQQFLDNLLTKKRQSNQQADTTQVQETDYDKKMKCFCGSLNELHFKYCRSCGKELDTDILEKIKDRQPFQYSKCPECYQLTPVPGRKNHYCVRCGKEIGKTNQ